MNGRFLKGTDVCSTYLATLWAAIFSEKVGDSDVMVNNANRTKSVCDMFVCQSVMHIWIKQFCNSFPITHVYSRDWNHNVNKQQGQLPEMRWILELSHTYCFIVLLNESQLLNVRWGNKMVNNAIEDLCRRRYAHNQHLKMTFWQLTLF